MGAFDTHPLLTLATAASSHHLIQIVLAHRLLDDVGNDCFVTNDGVDCLTVGTGPGINKSFFTHNFNKSGLRYEVAVCIRTGWIVWIHGPSPPGDRNDLTIFRDGLKHLLRPGERVEADDGYIAEDPQLVKAPDMVRTKTGCCVTKTLRRAVGSTCHKITTIPYWYTKFYSP